MFLGGNVPSKNTHEYQTQLLKTMKFCQNVPYMYILKVKKFIVSAYLRLDSIKENIEGDANLHHPP